jgi:predicted outer membrane repeat protein
MGGSSGSLVLTNCQFNSNAAYRGGGLYTTRNTDIVGGRFIYNSALEGGGAIYGGEANLSIDVYFDGSGWQTTELSDNEALENMGEGIAWEEGSGGILIWSFLTGNNADDIDYV